MRRLNDPYLDTEESNGALGHLETARMHLDLARQYIKSEATSVHVVGTPGGIIIPP